jgi:hypothetical protein
MSAIDRIAELWSEARALSEIGAELGVSRSTIAGKIARARRRGDDRFGARSPSPGPKPRPRLKPRPKVREVRPGAPGVGNRRALPPVPPLAAVSLAALLPGQCKWPVNDRPPGRMIEIEFCARPAAPGSPYCEEHTRRTRPRATGGGSGPRTADLLWRPPPYRRRGEGRLRANGAAANGDAIDRLHSR